MTKIKAPGKWVEGLEPGLPVTDAARAVLRIRLKAVEQMLPLAARRADDDIEYVHQLRVATRRADAGLRLFEPCLGPKRLKKLRRQLRRIRRAAGEARECDVLGLQFTAFRSSVGKPARKAVDVVLHDNTRRRRAAQRRIEQILERHAPERLAKRRQRLLEKLQAPRPGRSAAAPSAILSLDDLSRTVLDDLVAGVLDAAGEDMAIIDNLHELRIRSKRLRYAMEVFRCCIGAGFERAYGLVQGLQERLGDVNDAHEMLVRVEGLDHLPDDDAGRTALLASLRQRRDDLAAAFVADWTAGAWTPLLETLAAVTRHPAPDEGSVGAGP